jgi:hypothetical protein
LGFGGLRGLHFVLLVFGSEELQEDDGLGYFRGKFVEGGRRKRGGWGEKAERKGYKDGRRHT